MQASANSLISQFSIKHSVRDKLRPIYGVGEVTNKGPNWLCVKYASGTTVSYHDTQINNLINVTKENRSAAWAKLRQVPEGAKEILITDVPDNSYFIMYNSSVGAVEIPVAYRKDKTGITRIRDNLNMHGKLNVDDKVVVVERAYAIQKTHDYFDWYNKLG